MVIFNDNTTDSMQCKKAVYLQLISIDISKFCALNQNMTHYQLTCRTLQSEIGDHNGKGFREKLDQFQIATAYIFETSQAI